MTELEKSKAIIKYIADSKKVTPVKLYTNSEIKNSYDCKVFGEGKFKVIIGDWEIVQKIIDENIRFINTFYQKYQIPLDPIYTGKMMKKLFNLIEQDFFPEHSRILAFHTGGLQGISGANELLKKQNRALIAVGD